MTTFTRTRRIAVSVAVGTALVVGAGGVGYATAAGTASKSVTACANSKGRLALANSKGKCAKGFKAVAINKQGPKGATGAKGAKGATGAKGAQGPGAKVFKANVVGSSGTTPIVTVGNYSYYGTCEASGSGASRTATAKFWVDPRGESSASFTTTYQTQQNAAAPVTGAYRGSSSSDPQSLFASANGASSATYLYIPAMHVIGSDGVIQIVSLNVTATTSQGLLTVPCRFEGTITPAA